MNVALHALHDVFAQVSPFREMGSEFRGRRAELTFMDAIYVALIVFGVAAVVWLLRRMLSKQERGKPFFSYRRLFRELCHAHQLNRKSRGAMQRLAKHMKLQHPALLFLQPSAFALARDYPHRRDRQTLAQLREKLFTWMVTPAEAEAPRPAV